MSYRRVPIALALSLIACGDATPVSKAPTAPQAPSASATAAATPLEPPDDALPKLRTGSFDPVDEATRCNPRVVGRYVADGYETLMAAIPCGGPGLDKESASSQVTVAIDFPAGEPTPVAFVQAASASGTDPISRRLDGKPGLWIRRVATDQGPLTGEIFVPADPEHGTPGKGIHFTVSISQVLPTDSSVGRRWMRALRDAIGSTGTPWATFAAKRLDALAELGDPKAKGSRSLAGRALGTSSRSDELAELMDTSSGVTAIQDALQTDRSLFARAAREKPTVPLSSLKGPDLGHYPWTEMLSRLGSVPAEPLATGVPADFYYVRARDLPSLLRLLDQVDTWGTAMASIHDHASEDQGIAGRYETQLALKRGPLTRALGSSVIGEVAIVGSDPYVKEGSDMTVLLRVKNRQLFDAALTLTLGELEKTHGPTIREERQHGGVSVHIARSTDGAIDQERATVGDVDIVSNSAAAMDRVLDAQAGACPRLKDEPDFQFMMARDSQTRSDVLAFMGDRFVTEVVGPKQKVLEARRQIAMSELATPGFAALLYGWMQGRSPATVADLLSTHLLGKEEMTHASGAPITWSPGTAAHSSWGSVTSMVPLIDLPVPITVTSSEQAGYQRFVNSYHDDWASYVDPAALRIAFDGVDKEQTMTVDVRELPLPREADYDDLFAFVGSARFAQTGLASGMRLVAAIGADSWPRKNLGSTLHDLTSHDVKFDWIGDWAAIGIADRSVLASALMKLDPTSIPQKPEPEAPAEADADVLRTVTSLPIFAQVAVKGVAQAALALGALHVIANETIPGMFDWDEVGRYRDVSIVRIAIKKELARGLIHSAPSVQIFYAVTDQAITFTLQDWLLRRLIDEQLDGKAPAAAAAPEGAQFAFSLAGERGKGLWTTLAWGIEKKLIEGSEWGSSLATALMRGAPEAANDPTAIRALGFATLGASPVTPDGAAYEFSREGARDPARGTPYAPRWPDVPVPGSPLSTVLNSLSGVRTQMAFDDEGKSVDNNVHSLHATVVLDIR